MSKKVLKGAALATILGTVVQFGGCLGNWNPQRLLWNAVEYGALEWVLDNDTGVIDLWEDGAV